MTKIQTIVNTPQGNKTADFELQDKTHLKMTLYADSGERMAWISIDIYRLEKMIDFFKKGKLYST